MITNVHEFVNNAFSQATGISELILTETLDNIVDVGKDMLNRLDGDYDSYTRALLNQVGRTIIKSPEYERLYPDLYVTSTEYGSAIRKINILLPSAVENPSKNLEDKKSYNQDTFLSPNVKEKYYNKRVTFEIDFSIPDNQVKESFSSQSQLTAFINGIYNSVQTAIKCRVDELSQRCVNAMIARTVKSSYADVSDLSGVGDLKSVNLLKKYNTFFNKDLSVNNCLYDIDFLKFSASQIKLTCERMRTLSTRFNVSGIETSTSNVNRKVILHSDYTSNYNTYLRSNTFNDSYLNLPEHSTIPFWQFSGKNFDFADTSNIKINIDNAEINVSGIIGVAFDKNCCMASLQDFRTPTHYNAKAEFTNYFSKFDGMYLNDLNENFVVFFIK